jgi:Protein of unknown function (DUF1360)
MKQAISLIIDIIATYRLTKLVMEDEITEGLREFVYTHFPKGKLAYLISCPWCISIWAAIVIFAIRRFYPQYADTLSSVLAASAVTGVAYTGHL